jgi:hypothetical protein
VSGCKVKIRGYFEKVGFVPFTRRYLQNKAVQHNSADDPMADEYDALEYHNSALCTFLNVFGYSLRPGPLGQWEYI